MKNKFNTLRPYIYEYSTQEHLKKTINGLFRSIFEPVISNQKFESVVLLRLLDTEDKKSLLQRLTYTKTNIYSYNNVLQEYNLENNQKENIWDKTEFAIVLGQRYSAALIWDYSNSLHEDVSEVCLLYNSKIISEISKKIADNSKTDISDYIVKYAPDRRENILLNKSINEIAKHLNERNLEMIYAQAEKNEINSNDDTLKTAEIVGKKAKFIAHEIKNNLSIINLYSKILEKRIETVKADEDILTSVKNCIENVTKSSENISSLINDLRCISAPYLTEVNIISTIKNVILLCKEKGKEKNIKIKLNENSSNYVLTTDKTKLECALINIIFNAIDALKKEGIINIDIIEEQKFLRILISNNGEKIPKEVQNHIFEPDYTTKENGNGLGLAICKNQIELINGSISLVSSDENKTTFEISLPLK